MIKLVAIANKPPTMSVDELRRWWLDIHAPIAKKLPGLRKYVVSVTVGAPDEVPKYDGIAELWFDDMAALQNALQSPELAEALKDLEAHKVTPAMIFTEEHVIV